MLKISHHLHAVRIKFNRIYKYEQQDNVISKIKKKKNMHWDEGITFRWDKTQTRYISVSQVYYIHAKKPYGKNLYFHAKY